jgi:hypothetical protein
MGSKTSYDSNLQIIYPIVGDQTQEQTPTATAQPSRVATISHHFVSHTAQQQFVHRFVRALITGCIPLIYIENKDLQAACAAVGVTLPSRKVVSGRILDSMFNDVQTSNSDTLKQLQLFDAASDGWRKKYCALGDAM